MLEKNSKPDKLDEGYIKFNCQHTIAKWQDASMPLPPDMEKKLKNLDYFRTSLWRAQLIGVYENGIGYGNISVRSYENFIISASATGMHEILGFEGYCFIPKIDINSNCVWSVGAFKASSETMTHAAIYASAPNVNYVVHVHDKKLYTRLLAQETILKTQENIPYGTVEMAYALIGIAKENPNGACVVMGGHDEGILFYDTSLENVQKRMKEYYFLEE